VLVTLRA